MDSQYIDMAAKAKEMQETIALKSKMNNTKHKSDELMEALSIAKAKLIPANQNTKQIKQIAAINKDSNLEIIASKIKQTVQVKHKKFKL
jgi:hypothetical protein